MKNIFFIVFIIFCITFASQVLAEEKLTVCYKAYYFIPLGEACIEYSFDSDKIKISSYIKTNTLISLIKRIDNKGYSFLDLKRGVYHFNFFQREGNYKRDHIYTYSHTKLNYKIIKFKKGKKHIKEGVVNKKYVFDPYFYSLNLQCGLHRNNFNLFYDKRTYNISTNETKREGYRKIRLKPDIKTSGLLVPKGYWWIFVNEDMMMERVWVEFTIGKAKLKSVSVDGDRNLIKKICDKLVNVYLLWYN
ncbi:DUF3108 domain-containing protein [Deferribacter autotrophicus]|uniref:DUF3108 domain-containing protein n=1 Tax=Deferribacter autotrophicus TaxID=500465 RepID=A0A5A8F2L3_9BACT|nr:DUF3108 domain-containing protein [Deferribacter autotrophicus]KAA0258365.1 DUF3108 domain-containing protein [Deferribacter autotrophicus]